MGQTDKMHPSRIINLEGCNYPSPCCGVGRCDQFALDSWAKEGSYLNASCTVYVIWVAPHQVGWGEQGQEVSEARKVHPNISLEIGGSFSFCCAVIGTCTL